MSKKLLYSIVVDIISYLPALISWLMAKNISFGLAKKDLQIFTFGWFIIGAILIYAFYKSRIGIFGGALQTIQGILKSLGIISLATPMPMAMATWIIMGFYNVIQAMVNGTRNVQRKMENRRQQKRYEYREKNSKKKMKWSIQAGFGVFVFMTVVLWPVEELAKYVCQNVPDGWLVKLALAGTYIALFIALRLIDKLFGGNPWNLFKSLVIGTGNLFNNMSTWLFALVFVVLIVFSYSLCLFYPWFAILTDLDMVFVDSLIKTPVDLLTHKAWDNWEQKIFHQGELWLPANVSPPNWLHKNNFSSDDQIYYLTARFHEQIKSATVAYDTPLYAAAGLAVQESGGKAGALAEKKGEPSLGFTQVQSAFLASVGLPTRKSTFASKSSNRSMLEWERSRHLIMFCGFKTNAPIIGDIWEWIKWLVVSCIDFRATTRVIDFSVGMIKYYHDQYQKKYPDASSDELWRAAMMDWNEGPGDGWDLRNGKTAYLYFNKGNRYCKLIGSR